MAISNHLFDDLTSVKQATLSQVSSPAKVAQPSSPVHPPQTSLSATSPISGFIALCENLTESIAARIQSLLFPSSIAAFPSSIYSDPSAFIASNPSTAIPPASPAAPDAHTSSSANPSAPAPDPLLLSDEANKTIHTLECVSRTLKRMIDTRLALAKAAPLVVPALTTAPPTGAQLPGGQPRQLTSDSPESPTAQIFPQAENQFSQVSATSVPVLQPTTCTMQSATFPQKPATCTMQPAPLPATPATSTVRPATRPPLPAASLSRLLSPDHGLTF